VLVPGLARADDGGWWDAIWKWDAKLTGLNTEFHLLCMDGASRRVMGCEEWFKNIGGLFGRKVVHHFKVRTNPDDAVGPATFQPMTFDQVKHEVNLRVGYYHNYGHRYSAPEPDIDGSINAVPTILTYYYHVNEHFAVGAGMGMVTIYGDRFEPFNRPIVVPASYVIRPFSGHRGWGAFVLRGEINYMPEGFSAADFGDAADPRDPAKLVSNYSNRSEWHATIGLGFDLRGIGTYK